MKENNLHVQTNRRLKPQLTWIRQQSSQNNLFNSDTSVQNKKTSVSICELAWKFRLWYLLAGESKIYSKYSFKIQES